MLKNAKVIKTICFIAILGLLLTAFHKVFSFKYSDGILPLETFYEEKKNSIDVIFFGSSHIFENVNTGTLWSEYGIAGFDLCGSVQPVWNTYYYIKEALKSQKPEVLVVDVMGAIQTEDYIDHSRIIKNNYGLKLSVDKIDSVKASSPKESWLDYLLEYPTYHSRYQEVNRTDFCEYLGIPNWDCWKGFGMNTATKALTAPAGLGDVTEIGEITPKVEEYLYGIIALAREKEVPLQFIVTPYVLGEDAQKIYNRVEQIAVQNGVPFLNFNLCYDEMGLDFSTDFADENHMNHRGNVKFTRYLADFLKSNYDIPDRRGDENYQSWEIMAEDCSQRIYNQELKEISDIGTWLDKAQNENYLLVYTAAGDMKNIDNYEAVKAEMLSMGINLDDMGENGAWVVAGGKKLLWSSANNDTMVWHDDVGRNARLMVQMPDLQEKEEGGSVMPVVNLNNKEYKKVDQGLNVFVYDTFTESFVENVGFVISNGSLQYTKQ